MESLRLLTTEQRGLTLRQGYLDAGGSICRLGEVAACIAP